jgi:hypothetical protein
MSVLNSLVDAPGIMAACGGEKGSIIFVFGENVPPSDSAKWREIFMNLQTILDLAREEEDVKLVLGNYSIVLRRNQSVYVGVIAMKGHSVIKSLQRMVRRAFKHFGAPVHDGRRRLLAPSAPSTTSTSWTSPATPAPVPDSTPFDPHNDPER